MTKTNQKSQAVEKEESLTPEEHLEAILFQFVNLYERWSEDRQVTAKQSADLAKFVKEFAQQVNQFASLEEKVRDDIHTSMRTEAENMAVYLGRKIGDAASEEVEPTVRQLRDVVDESESVLSRYQSSVRFANCKMVVVSVFSSLLFALLIVFFLMPKPVLPISDEQIEYLKFGESMRYVWPKLLKTEQEHIKKLAADVHKAQIGKG
jgi:hypothetical protein